jgi:hypothetical protein
MGRYLFYIMGEKQGGWFGLQLHPEGRNCGEGLIKLDTGKKCLTPRGRYAICLYIPDMYPADPTPASLGQVQPCAASHGGDDGGGFAMLK